MVNIDAHDTRIRKITIKIVNTEFCIFHRRFGLHGGSIRHGGCNLRFRHSATGKTGRWLAGGKFQIRQWLRQRFRRVFAGGFGQICLGQRFRHTRTRGRTFRHLVGLLLEKRKDHDHSACRMRVLARRLRSCNDQPNEHQQNCQYRAEGLIQP